MFVIVIKLLIFASSNSSNFFLDRNNEINLNDQTLFNVILIRDQLSNLKFNLLSNNININFFSFLRILSRPDIHYFVPCKVN